jgi:hypothetical protein
MSDSDVEMSSTDRDYESINESIVNLTLQSIREKDNSTEMGSFDYLPKTFHGLDTSTFGTSVRGKNPFLELKRIALDRLIDYKDRFQTIRYMQRIPRSDKYTHINECMENILTDINIPFHDRYIFFSNNERIIKLDYQILNHCHIFMYRQPNIPFLYKIISAEYILSTMPSDTYDSSELQNFLYVTGKDKNMQINYRSECGDILNRVGYKTAKDNCDWHSKGLEIINELGNMYVENEKQTIYSNAENVHDSTVNESIIESLRYLLANTVVDEDINSGTIYEAVLQSLQDYVRKTLDNNKMQTSTLTGYYPLNKEMAISKEKIASSFQRIILDPAKYEGRNMLDVLLVIWQNIITNPHKDELITRLIQELNEMDDTCSTGHLSRLINVLSGYTNIQTVKISYPTQLRANVFAYLTANMRLLSEEERGVIFNEMSESGSLENKPTIAEFSERFSPYSDLKEEFSSYISGDEFDECYKKSVREFFNLV